MLFHGNVMRKPKRIQCFSISAIAKETAHRAGSMVPDSMYFKLVSENPDPMHKIKLIQHLAPRHTRQRDSWLPSA